jgi:iron complex outermembrane receptor protein
VEPSNLNVDTPETLEQQGYSATPVSLSTTTTYYGYYLTDTFDISHELSSTASVRYNVAQVELTDHNGAALNGENRYSHFNPSLGLTYVFTAAMNAFARWSINNRTPTVSEIECSDLTQPCLLPASLAGDPPSLKQVVSHTYEIGVRGGFGEGADASAGRLSWSVTAFRADLGNDIYAIWTPLHSGFFQNIGSTRREGVDAGLNYRGKGVSAYAGYSYVDATFRSRFTESSPSNPFADEYGDIQIRPGDRLPGVPLHRFKAGADVEVLWGWTVGASVVVASPQFYRGDESNQNPEIPGYHVLDLHTSFRVTRHVDLFATVQNLLNEHYSTFGTYSDPTGIGAPGIPQDAQTNGPGVDNRFLSPAAPLAAFGGIRLRY